MVHEERGYKTDLGQYKLILKWRKTITNLKPNDLPRGVLLKQRNLKDLHFLLGKHYGDNWQDNEKLSFFKELFKQQEAISIGGSNPRGEDGIVHSDCGDIIEDYVETDV